MDTLKGLNYARQAKNSLFKFTDDAGNAQIASYVRIYLYIANTILIILGILAVFFQHWFVGFASVAVGIIIILLELTWVVPSIENAMKFFLENYLWRAIAYLVLSLPCFFSLETLFGALLVALGAVGYAICSIKGEEPTLGDANPPIEEKTQPPPGSGWFDDEAQ
mmetsp:Transcript_132207/g.196978  ORF Transcript_132207/g.196978 Transcript_132207/m.196978 type:complete len:165 (-) Transcript_132207:19-513(-)|eukprot:CAMPEP_0117043754 /NCGR_PEP_ID=MMETSP0472-20121206/30389_1 /TAXON_ID=693140 ORGANISM="Tiarina fusus, Strain LIS" /NCGR_SAMPLE_ID=MMETSP0472 /ASSEMBLY_ACC=CAM_ASM_000603 /LENGTH=164 /DNA_ID=CAMNT_0004755349 /DNA_START=24 /DNA_END=518 /DNA_ORIENTATION=+